MPYITFTASSSSLRKNSSSKIDSKSAQAARTAVCRPTRAQPTRRSRPTRTSLVFPVNLHVDPCPPSQLAGPLTARDETVSRIIEAFFPRHPIVSLCHCRCIVVGIKNASASLPRSPRRATLYLRDGRRLSSLQPFRSATRDLPRERQQHRQKCPVSSGVLSKI